MKSYSKVSSKSIIICAGIFPPDIGGPATYAVGIADSLFNQGYRVSVITYSDKSSGLVKYHYPVYRLARVNTAVNYLKYIIKLLSVGRQADTLYVLDTFSAAFPVAIANLILEKKMVIRVGGLFSWEQAYQRGWTSMDFDDFYTHRSSLLSEILKKTEFWVLSRTDIIITNSNYLKNVLVKIGHDGKNIKIIHNSTSPAKRLRKNSRKPKGVIHLFSSGRFVPWKNFDRLIMSVKDLSGVDLTISGDGPLLGSCTEIIRSQGLQDKVHLLGRISRSQMESQYGKADIFILLSSFEGMSHQILEAMSWGLPIIASDIEPNRELLSGYPRSHLIPVNELSQKILMDSIGEVLNERQIHTKKLTKILNSYLNRDIGQLTIQYL